ncbi:hypothetical protein PM082_010167 [Marasmius tenuissimus]|nr:hypothetical protein PM082_010167 [Marasmius tenuissimus]
MHETPPSHTIIPYNSPEGRLLFLEIARSHLPFVPHDFSVEVAAEFFDQQDILVRTACGSGKTGTIALIAVLMTEIKKNPARFQQFNLWFPDNPAILVICPTDALEVNIQEEKMLKMKIPAVALNSKIIHSHMHNGNLGELWEKIRTATIILMSPEMLQSQPVRKHLALDQEVSKSEFKSRCTLLVCDEAHLVYVWGRNFRESFKNIGLMRVHLPLTRLLLLTATLQDGPALDFVLPSFGLETKKFIDMHRSNLRPEIQVTTSLLESNLNAARSFPEFDWIMPLLRITIVFCPDWQLAKWITLHLQRSFYGAGSKEWRRVRKWDATNDKETYDEETLKMIESLDPEKERLIIVCTVILMVGMDFRHVQRILNINCMDFDEELQKEGRLLREMDSFLKWAELYVYVSKAVMKTVRETVEAHNKGMDSTKDDRNSGASRSCPTLDINYAHHLVAECRTEVQNTVYNNPPLNKYLCGCPVCVQNRTPQHQTSLSLDTPPPCLCSGCQPGMCERDLRSLYRENTLHASAEATRKGFGLGVVEGPPEYADENQDGAASEVVEEEIRGMTAASQDIINQHLVQLDADLFQAGTGNIRGFLTPGMFIPSPVISIITEKFLAIITDWDGPARLSMELEDYDMDPRWLEAIWKTITQKIYPAIKQYHQQRELENEQRKREQKRAKLEKEVKALNEQDTRTLVVFEPILEEEKVTNKLTKDHLTWELRWHRLWDVDLPKPYKLNKAEFISVIRGAV